jgi:hypothetical protein
MRERRSGTQLFQKESWVPGLAEPVIGLRLARTRWLARDTKPY